jgi:15-cis-phytoene desaturase
MATTVIVIGGGVAGLTAAHELAERGFKVDIYEPRATWGGKARSQPVTGTGTSGRRDLPGEHGFRFYPRFYKHVIDTMQRIPSGTGFVADHLQATTESAIALVDDTTWYRFARQRVTKPYDILEALELFFKELDFDDGDVGVFCAKILEFFTSCEERREQQYEQATWWQFLEADLCSPKFQRQLKSIPRMLVAMDAQHGSAFTVGTITMQLLLDYASTGVNNDRTMGGPTTQMWIEPWTAQLATFGVGLHASTQVASIDVAGGQISGITLAGGATATADYYVLAVPIDTVVGLITPAIAALDPALALLATKTPADLVSWMSGIQFYLYEDVPLVRGHTFYPDSTWALTSISQPQFWRGLGLFRRTFGDGEAGGLLSVDISEWDTPGVYTPKTAKQCTPDEIAKEVWAQLKAALNGKEPDEQILTDDLLMSWHLDEDLDFSAGLPPANRSRLLVHPPGSWAYRPQAGTQIANLVLAGDYVRTFTNIASMEGANEAARRAVNEILARSGSTAALAQVWPLDEPDVFETWKALDRRLFEHGKPHIFELMGIRRAAQAADLLRRFSAFTGLSKIDDLLDKVKATAIIRNLLGRLGVPLGADNA